MKRTGLFLAIILAAALSLPAQESGQVGSGIPVHTEDKDSTNPDAIQFPSTARDATQKQSLFKGVDKDTMTYYQIGKASWYGKRFHGRKTASGQRFDMYQYTAAHRTLPFGTRVMVRNLDSGKEITVTINDRGPFQENRILDLSYAAAVSLGFAEDGIAKVGMIIIDSSPIQSADTTGNKNVRLNLMDQDNLPQQKPEQPVKDTTANDSDDPFRKWEKNGKTQENPKDRSALTLREENTPEPKNQTKEKFSFDDTKEDRDNQKPEVAPRSDSLTLQVGSFQVMDNARRMKVDLEKKFHQPVYIQKKKGWFKVMLGSFPDKSEAKKLQRQLKENGIKAFLKKL